MRHLIACAGLCVGLALSAGGSVGHAQLTASQVYRSAQETWPLEPAAGQSVQRARPLDLPVYHSVHETEPLSPAAGQSVI